MEKDVKKKGEESNLMKRTGGNRRKYLHTELKAKKEIRL